MFTLTEKITRETESAREREFRCGNIIMFTLIEKKNYKRENLIVFILTKTF